jgi:HAD superfamily hydrolase (TIGR01509 family)
VLVDSERIAVRLDVQVLAQLGWPITEEEVIDRFVGKTDEAMTREIEEHLGRKLPGAWDEEYGHLYREAFDAELEPVDGIWEALEQIPVRTCVASSGRLEKIEKNLRLTGLWERFAGRIFSAADVEHGKPAPDLFLHAAEKMGAGPSACAVVEDSPFGVEAAHAAGMKAYAYSGGIMPAERLESADAVFNDMRDLPGLLGFGAR